MLVCQHHRQCDQYEVCRSVEILFKLTGGTRRKCASTICDVYISKYAVPLRHSWKLILTSFANVLVPYMMYISSSMPTIEIIHRVPINIQSYCAGTIYDIHITEHCRPWRYASEIPIDTISDDASTIRDILTTENADHRDIKERYPSISRTTVPVSYATCTSPSMLTTKPLLELPLQIRSGEYYSHMQYAHRRTCRPSRYNSKQSVKIISDYASTT